MNNNPIEYSKNCTYLGLKIDSKLTWKEHVEEKINKCKRFLMKTVHETRANFGPKPKLMKWGFTGMLSPVLTYGAMIWGHTANSKTTQEKLRRLNRLACNTIAAVRKSNPTRALEIIYDLPPLHLLIMKMGLRTYARVQGQLDLKLDTAQSNMWKRNSHRKYWETLASKANLELKNTDTICETIREKYFKVNIGSFDGKKKHLRMAEYNVYTDGSRLEVL